MYTINNLRLINAPENTILVKHSHIRLYERNISINDIINIINNGDIIEKYTHAEKIAITDFVSAA